MTLDHVEVSSNAIFESGQLYVGLSRATELEGLTVTGYSREQLEMDEDVLRFYDKAPWEDLGVPNVPTPHEQAAKEATPISESTTVHQSLEQTEIDICTESQD
jgi:hypothetical protein